MFEVFWEQYCVALSRADRIAETEHLSGEPALESPDYKGPYDELIKTLELAKQRAEEHRDHEHVWDEDCGFCLICFADGNA